MRIAPRLLDDCPTPRARRSTTRVDELPPRRRRGSSSLAAARPRGLIAAQPQHELRAAEERHRRARPVADRRVPELRRAAAVHEPRLAA